MLAKASAQHCTKEKPRVLIIGAGIGGLMLAILLQAGGIPYEIIERANEVKPLGSGLTLGSNVKALFKQLGIYQDFLKVGKYGDNVKLLDDNLNLQKVVDFSPRQKMCGAYEYIVARPDLHNLLLSRVPKERLHMGAKMLSFHQDDKGVTIKCANGKSFKGDILVGADGAQSSVRENLYKMLKAQGKLPPSDDKPMPFGCVCLVGQTRPLDPEEFPHLKSPSTEFTAVFGVEKDSTRVTITTKKNTICWVNLKFLRNRTDKGSEYFHNAGWGPDATEAMCQEVRHLKMPGGKDGKQITMGDLIDQTPKDLISKVVLEEKVFKTWYSGRTVLLGDAIHDAVALSNWICAIRSTSLPALAEAFEEYQAERRPIAVEALRMSQILCTLGGKTLWSKFLRAVFKRMPDWMWNLFLYRMSVSRPQASFLPLQPDTGAVRPLYQASLYKTLAMLNRYQS
ncbi:hypothetical protein BGZ94_000268 [Podila epigama]|nr:hypothetical protein BGZ94_000268 [Podila epigama]